MLGVVVLSYIFIIFIMFGGVVCALLNLDTEKRDVTIDDIRGLDEVFNKNK